MKRMRRSLGLRLIIFFRERFNHENSRYRGEGVRLINDHASRKDGGEGEGEGWKRGQKARKTRNERNRVDEGCLRPLSRSKKWNT